ncbi:MAG TPA: response regulator transcription factor [Cyclobacteriaceae bacterium]|nr:response regulator transcription factor [Cyclobacteriaceae bacterium]
MINTIIVDDHVLFCDGLERVLTDTRQFRVVNKFNSGKGLLNKPIDPNVNLLIIDIEMPGLNGFDVIKRLRLKNKQLKIVILSMHEEEAFSNEASTIGANAFLSKTLDSSTLVDILIRTIHGETFFLPQLPPKENSNLLSDREVEVLRLISKGKTSKEIGIELNISPLTIKAHRRNMIKKLQVNNSTELISKALEIGIL